MNDDEALEPKENQVNEPTRHYLVDVRNPASVFVADYATRLEATSNPDHLPSIGVFMISIASDLEHLSGPQLVAVFNKIRRGAEVKKFENTATAIRRVWTMLQAPRDLAEAREAREPVVIESIATEEASVPAKKAKATKVKTPGAKKAKVAKSAYDKNGTETNDSIEKVFAMISRANGATKEEIVAALGCTEGSASNFVCYARRAHKDIEIKLAPATAAGRRAYKLVDAS